MAKQLKVWTISLGCPKNRVDTETLLARLNARAVESPARADLALINTCAFIEPATRESIRTILDAAKRLGRLKRRPMLAVAGCLPGRYGVADLAKGLPEADIWLPTREMDRWPEIIRKRLGLAAGEAGPRLISTFPYAWLKIAEGCNHRCSFCAIPQIRGGLRSMEPAAILAEARSIVSQGIGEIGLVAQDVSAWGSDFDRALRDKWTLPGLVEQLAGTDGLRRLRLMYLYPNAVNDDLLRLMADVGAPVLPYLDIPLQHVSRGILERMGRPFQAGGREALERVRRWLPDAVIRTTFITGFPGESEADFRELERFVAEAELDNVGVFAYCPEEGTRAAGMPDQVAKELAKERRGLLMEAQAHVSRRRLARHVGEVLQVLVDRPQGEWPGLYVGRAWFQAPEVDGVVYLSGEGVRVGDYVDVRIEESHDYDLSGLVE